MLRKYKLTILGGMLFVGSVGYCAEMPGTPEHVAAIRARFYIAVGGSEQTYNEALEAASTNYAVSPQRVGLEVTSLSPSLRPGARGGSRRMLTVTISPQAPTLHEEVTLRTETI